MGLHISLYWAVGVLNRRWVSRYGLVLGRAGPVLTVLTESPRVHKQSARYHEDAIPASDGSDMDVDPCYAIKDGDGNLQIAV